MLQMLVERRELVAVEVHDAPAALALKEAAVRCAAVGAELIVRALVRRDLVDAALPAHAHWAALAKPLGGLGRLEGMVEDAAALTGESARSERQSSTAFCCLVV